MSGRYVDVTEVQALCDAVVRLDAGDRHDVLVRRVCGDAVLRRAPALQAVPAAGLRPPRRRRGVAAAQVLQRLQPPRQVSALQRRGLPLREAARRDVWHRHGQASVSTTPATSHPASHLINPRPAGRSAGFPRILESPGFFSWKFQDLESPEKSLWSWKVLEIKA